MVNYNGAMLAFGAIPSEHGHQTTYTECDVAWDTIVDSLFKTRRCRIGSAYPFTGRGSGRVMAS